MFWSNSLEYHELQLFSLKDDLEEKEEKLSRMIEKMAKPRIIISILLFSLPDYSNSDVRRPREAPEEHAGPCEQRKDEDKQKTGPGQEEERCEEEYIVNTWYTVFFQRVSPKRYKLD